ncbi:MAG TPA: hypothetical protein VM867_02135 [Xanthobacteraceae bacterium]|nr:hypothetical protein [Xanthobacteraceae bacterium]
MVSRPALLAISCASALGFYVFGAAAQGLPGINVETTCRASAKSVFEAIGDSTVATVENCLKQEDAARTQILKKWDTFLPAERAQCINPKVYMPSYVEWLTCLEMRLDLRSAPKE